MSDCGCEIEITDKEQAKTLIILLLINGAMFIAEIIAGVLADSTALIADSLDMLADASVYAIGLYAVGKTMGVKARAAHISGLLQILLGLGVLADIIRRALLGSEPEPGFMLIVGAIALVANSICLVLIHKHREGEVHMRASWIFSKNDVIANLGVIISGLLVLTLDTRWPDLIIGLIITVVVVRGGLHIIKDAGQERRNMANEG
ncbi:MAG TPA: cation transporter [Gammaproteobacteria bacterium]|nr:cation transporter [Gammaproteobacteria bacterium]